MIECYQFIGYVDWFWYGQFGLNRLVLDFYALSDVCWLPTIRVVLADKFA